MRVLVVGGSGLLGSELVRQALTLGYDVCATYARTPGPETACWHHLDLRSGTVELPHQPAVVINAAYAGADWQVSAAGAARVAAATVPQGARLVHVSTDALFAGRDTAYVESDDPSPITPYGAAKAAAELAVASLDPRAVIARSSLIVSSTGASIVERFVHELGSGTTGFLFTDEYRCPVDVGDLGSALLELAVTDRHGVHHVGGADAVSRLELGRLIAARDGLDPSLLPSRTQDMERWRPRDVRLDSSATQAALTTRLRGAREFLRVASAP